MAQRDNGVELLVLAALLSIQIAAGRSTEELAVLAALFTILGDNLALLATTRTEPAAEPSHCPKAEEADLAKSPPN